MARLQRGIGGTLILDAEGLVKLSNGNPAAVSRTREAFARGANVVTAATTLTEVLRGGPRDAALHRVLRKIRVVAIDETSARAAGKLLGRTGLSGHRCALDALLVTVALNQNRPAVILTSDAGDISKLAEEPGKSKNERISVIRI